jgi:hypothetical protein
MDYFEQHGISADRMRLSQSAAYEPLTSRIESAWQGENSRVEVFLLDELAEERPGMEPAADADSAKAAH